jgi:two-component system response regulator YesN
MLKVMIADDERIIREGLRNSIVWEDYDFEICGLAENGLAALEIMEKMNPDLAIVDIKMPGLDGLTLIAKAAEEGLNTIFVILSGYSEFDYAKRAMRFGVKYYLTKPYADKDLTDIIESARCDIKNRQRETALLSSAIKNCETVLPETEEKILQKVLSGTLENDSSANVWNLLGIQIQNVRIAVFPCGSYLTPKQQQQATRFAVQALPNQNFRKCLFYQTNLVLIAGAVNRNEMETACKKIELWLQQQTGNPIFHMQSWTGNLKNFRSMYLQTVLCMKYGIQIFESETEQKPVFRFSQDGAELCEPDLYKDSLRLIRINLDRAAESLEVKDLQHLKGLCIASCLNLFAELIPDQAGDFVEKLLPVESIGEAEKIKKFAAILMMEAVATGEKFSKNDYSPTIRKMIHYIKSNLQCSNLSLAYISKEVLFMNENYIGKLFAKETGVKFSQYLTNIRIYKAILLLRSKQNYKIYEITQQCGFGMNTQYFSQVFKKQTSFMPSEFYKL